MRVETRQFSLTTVALCLVGAFVVAWTVVSGNLGGNAMPWLVNSSYLITCVLALTSGYAAWSHKANTLQKENSGVRWPPPKAIPLVYVGSGIAGALLTRYFLPLSHGELYGTLFFVFAVAGLITVAALYGIWRLFGHGKKLENTAATLLFVIGLAAAPITMDWARNDLTMGQSFVALVYFMAPLLFYVSGTFPYKSRRQK
jgi:hypothetical protein